jgi:hypothetical protein
VLLVSPVDADQQSRFRRLCLSKVVFHGNSGDTGEK